MLKTTTDSFLWGEKSYTTCKMDKKSDNIYRFAPSPSGVLHVGGARTAIFNWLLAKRSGGKFLLRIEDTDKKRSTNESIKQIINGLKWLDLDWDGEPVYQSTQGDIYTRVAQKLLETGKAYHCFCSSDMLQAERKMAESQKKAFLYDGRCDRLEQEEIERRLEHDDPYVLRLRIGDGETTFNDHIRGQISVSHSELDDFVILRSNGTAIYHLAVVVDDHHMGVTHVIRGDDHLSNTPKQILIQKALDWSVPEYGHVPLIHGPDGGRLSKRHGASSVEDFRESGYLTDAVFNYLCLLGWSPGDDKEIFSREELIDVFSLERINKKNAVFDEKKLKWMNGKFISQQTTSSLIKLLEPNLQNDEKQIIIEKEKDFGKLIDLIKTRAQSILEIYESSTFFYKDPDKYEEKGVEKYFSDQKNCKYLEEIRDSFERLSSFGPENIEQVLRGKAESLNIKAGELIHPIRLALTGRTVSPGIFDVISILGKDTVIKRLDAAISFIQK